MSAQEARLDKEPTKRPVRKDFRHYGRLIYPPASFHKRALRKVNLINGLEVNRQ